MLRTLRNKGRALASATATLALAGCLAFALAGCSSSDGADGSDAPATPAVEQEVDADAEAAMRNLEEATAANPAWSSLSAVQNGRYITLDPTLYLSKPNAHWSDAYQGLFDSLYGQPARS